MDMDKICTILLLLALMVIICRNSSELGIEGYDVEQKKEELIKDIDFQSRLPAQKRET